MSRQQLCNTIVQPTITTLLYMLQIIIIMSIHRNIHPFILYTGNSMSIVLPKCCSWTIQPVHILFQKKYLYVFLVLVIPFVTPLSIQNPSSFTKVSIKEYKNTTTWNFQL